MASRFLGGLVSTPHCLCCRAHNHSARGHFPSISVVGGLVPKAVKQLESTYIDNCACNVQRN